MSNSRLPLEPLEQPTGSWHGTADSKPILGRYRFLEHIGAGGMGTVFKALHIHLKQIVAIKTIKLSGDRKADAGLADRFLREMAAAGRIQDVNVVRATDGGEEDGTYFLVMEYVDGVDLDQLSRIAAPLALPDASELIRQAAQGLAAIHALRMTHRDIKPSNLLFSREKTVKITDLGLARVCRITEDIAEITPAGLILGTPDYMAPEQAHDPRTADGRADLYSLGCTYYRLLTGQPPYPAPRFASYSDKILAHQLQEVPGLQAAAALLRPNTDPAQLAEVDAILQRMMAKSPNDRFADAGEAVAALEPLAALSNLSRLWERWQDSKCSSQPAENSRPAVHIPTIVSSDASTRREVRPRRRAVLAAWLTGAILLLGGIAALSFGLGWIGPGLPGQDSDDGKDASVADDLPQLDSLAPYQWHSLLGRRPKALYWPRGEGVSHWEYNSGLEQVTASSQQRGFIQLGDTSAPNYKFSVGLMQTRWHGGIGVYIGARHPRRPGEPGRLQLFELNEQAGPGGKKQLELVRGLVELVPQDQGGLKLPATLVSSQRLDNVDGEQTVEITVENRTLKRVQINGTPLKELTVREANEIFQPTDCNGGFGLSVNFSDGLFRSARFMRLGDKP